MLETYTAFIENDLCGIRTLLEKKAYGEAYRRCAPVWADMLFICEAERRAGAPAEALAGAVGALGLQAEGIF